MSDTTLTYSINDHLTPLQALIHNETNLQSLCHSLSTHLMNLLNAKGCGIFLKMTESQTLKQFFLTENTTFTPIENLEIGQFYLQDAQLFMPLSIGSFMIGIIALEGVLKSELQTQKSELAQITLEISLKFHAMINEQRLNRKIRVINEHLLSYETDSDGHITNVTQALSDELGVQKQSVIGQQEGQLFPNASIEEDNKGTIIKLNAHTNKPVWLRSNKTFSLDCVIDKPIHYHLYENITALKQAEHRAVTDELTGLYNRRYFNQSFSREVDNAIRYQKIVAFIIIDIDNFKKYNDTYGHHDGDTALVRVAQTIQNCFRRKGDYVFRLGGEEFGVICNVTQPQDAETLANITRERVASLNLPHTGNPHRVVTISSGVVTVDQAHPADTNELYKMADQALYEAKNQGRNRVNVSGSGDDIEFF